MIWIFLLIAIAIIYLAVTQRLQGIEERLTLYWEKAKVAFQYWKEDVSDVEAELKQKQEAQAMQATSTDEIKKTTAADGS